MNRVGLSAERVGPRTRQEFKLRTSFGGSNWVVHRNNKGPWGSRLDRPYCQGRWGPRITGNDRHP